MICLHGAPGSQNGYAGSGLIGPILFPSNSSNGDRSLNVLKNLTEEFSQDAYGDTVTSIELLNEPGLFTGLFTMSQLQDFYTQGISTVHGVKETINVTLSGEIPHFVPHELHYSC
jgi:glucan 1,3-beta-glucosidase